MCSQEWPVVLLKWTDRDEDNRARTLEVVDEFRSYVKPVWRPTLSDFCISLTGITQVGAPIFVSSVFVLTPRLGQHWLASFFHR